jgi:hypothetical protein
MGNLPLKVSRQLETTTGATGHAPQARPAKDTPRRVLLWRVIPSQLGIDLNTTSLGMDIILANFAAGHRFPKESPRYDRPDSRVDAAIACNALTCNMLRRSGAGHHQGPWPVCVNEL